MAERDVLMHAISEMLSIPVVDKGVGSSVHNDFIDPLAEAVLGEDLSREFHDKYQKIRSVIEALGGTYVPANPDVRGIGDTSEGTSSGGGGTLTNLGLRKIRDLLMENGVPSLTYDDDPEVAVLESEGFSPEAIVDERVRRQAAVATRPGATKFRDSVRAAYGNRCCVTGADSLVALEAAHIAPYQGIKSDVVSNALLLRADIHKLHDALLLAVSDEDLTVLIKPSLRETVYAAFEGRAISEPKGHLVSAEALQFHRARCRL
jgi:hypothetical protein